MMRILMFRDVVVLFLQHFFGEENCQPNLRKLLCLSLHIQDST